MYPDVFLLSNKPFHWKDGISMFSFEVFESNSKWLHGVEGSIFYWFSCECMFRSNGHLTFDPYISYKWYRLASIASKREGIDGKGDFYGFIPKKEAVKVAEAKETTQYLRRRYYFAFLRSKRSPRSSRLLRSSWLMEPLRPLRLSDSLGILNSII